MTNKMNARKLTIGFTILLALMSAVCMAMWIGKFDFFVAKRPLREYISNQSNERMVHGNITRLSFQERLGRLGNWMFQFASTFGVAKRNGYLFTLSRTNTLRKIFKGINVADNVALEKERIVMQENTSADPKIMSLSGSRNIQLCCYLQSWRYFEGYEEEVREQFTFNDSIIQKVQGILNQFKAAYWQQTVEKSMQNSTTFIGIHVRRGDYLEISKHNKNYKVAPKSFIMNGMTYYRSRFNNSLFVMTSDDLQWCRQNFQDEITDGQLHLSPNLTYYEDMCLLTQCNHSIFTTGSFGWWSGWLTGGSVVHYGSSQNNKNLTGVKYQSNRYPAHWVAML